MSLKYKQAIIEYKPLDKTRPLSYSALQSYKLCPQRWYQSKVHNKESKDASYLVKGHTIHQQLEDYIKSDTITKPTHPDAIRAAKYICPLLKNSEEAHSELQLAINNSFVKVDWEGSFYRGIVDLLLINGEDGVIIDFKTGKYEASKDQLGSYGVLVFAAFPQLKTLRVGFFYTRTGKTVSWVLTREKAFDIIAPTVMNDCTELLNDEEWIATENKYCFNCPSKKGCSEYKGGE